MRIRDLFDGVLMKTTIEELEACLQWVSERDINPGWRKNIAFGFKNPSVIAQTIDQLEKKRGHFFEVRSKIRFSSLGLKNLSQMLS